ncbi:hypothetical protein BX600DRAFT_459417 [Xylariales sp. PMI_506]|nr:hypothetical protein BX600DRAFT_459417 [Xylariales sp. PMI_506]
MENLMCRCSEVDYRVPDDDTNILPIFLNYICRAACSYASVARGVDLDFAPGPALSRCRINPHLCAGGGHSSVCKSRGNARSPLVHILWALCCPSLICGPGGLVKVALDFVHTLSVLDRLRQQQRQVSSLLSPFLENVPHGQSVQEITQWCLYPIPIPPRTATCCCYTTLPCPAFPHLGWQRRFIPGQYLNDTSFTAYTLTPKVPGSWAATPAV